jgi:hypothetical protein
VPEDLARIQLMMLNMDPPKHTKLRALVNKGFTPRMVARLEPRLRAITNAIIDNVATIRRIHAERPVLRIKNLDEIIREEILHYPGAEIAYKPTGFSILADDLVPVIFRNMRLKAVM